MLTEIRDRSSGAFAWVIATLIIIPMAFWGVQEYASTEADPAIVEVGEVKITQSEFNSRFNNEQQRFRQAMGDNVDNDYLASDAFKQGVLQQMVNRALIKHVADEQNYRFGDVQLAQAIRESDLFKLDGEFNQEAYERFVVSSQYSKTRYENTLREDRRLQQVTTGFDESAIVLPDDVRALLEIQAEQRSFDMIALRKADYTEGLTVSDAEVADYYELNQNNFMAQEQVAVEFIELTRDALAEDIDVSEEELRALYDDNAESYVSSASRKTRHILLSTNSGEDDAEQLTKAEALVAELRGGADFAELAAANSQDTGTASNGGDLGFVERGQMVEEFEAATFSLQQNEISDPVKSQFGYHIIEVTEIQAEEQQSFAEVRFQLLQDERDQRADDLLIERVDLLRDLAYEQTDNLEGAAEQLGVALQTTEMFSRDAGEGIASSAIFRNAAFAEELLVDEINSEPLELSDGQYVVMRKASYQAAEPQPLTAVSDQINALLLAQKASEATSAAAQELLTRASVDWDQATSAEGAEVSTFTVSLIDQNRLVPPAVLQEVSNMQLADGGPAFSTAADFGGDVYVVRLHQVVAGNVNTIPEQIKESTRRILAQRNGRALLNSYIEGLSNNLAVDINNELLN